MLEIISNSSPGILRTPKSAENRGEFNSDDEKAVWICFRRCDGDIERMSGAWKAVRCRWEDLKDLQMMSGAWKAVRCLGEDLKDLQMMSGAFEDVRDLSKVSGTSQRPSDDLRDLSQMSRASLFLPFALIILLTAMNKRSRCHLTCREGKGQEPQCSFAILSSMPRETSFFRPSLQRGSTLPSSSTTPL